MSVTQRAVSVRRAQRRPAWGRQDALGQIVEPAVANAAGDEHAAMEEQFVQGSLGERSLRAPALVVALVVINVRPSKEARARRFPSRWIPPDGAGGASFAGQQHPRGGSRSMPALPPGRCVSAAVAPAPGREKWMPASAVWRKSILKEISSRGPLCSDDIDDDQRDHQGWGPQASLAKTTLHKLFFHGRVLIARRVGKPPVLRFARARPAGPHAGRRCALRHRDRPLGQLMKLPSAASSVSALTATWWRISFNRSLWKDARRLLSCNKTCPLEDANVPPGRGCWLRSTRFSISPFDPAALGLRLHLGGLYAGGAPGPWLLPRFLSCWS